MSSVRSFSFLLIKLYVYCNNPRNSTPEQVFISTSKRENLQHELSPMAKGSYTLIHPDSRKSLLAESRIISPEHHC